MLCPGRFIPGIRVQQPPGIPQGLAPSPLPANRRQGAAPGIFGYLQYFEASSAGRHPAICLQWVAPRGSVEPCQGCIQCSAPVSAHVTASISACCLLQTLRHFWGSSLQDTIRFIIHDGSVPGSEPICLLCALKLFLSVGKVSSLFSRHHRPQDM